MKPGGIRQRLGEWRDNLSDRFGISKRRKAPKDPNRRCVRFGPVTVTEFERLLCGGGGVPDGDAVSLGVFGRMCGLPCAHLTALARLGRSRRRRAHVRDQPP